MKNNSFPIPMTVLTTFEFRRTEITNSPFSIKKINDEKYTFYEFDVKSRGGKQLMSEEMQNRPPEGGIGGGAGNRTPDTTDMSRML